MQALVDALALAPDDVGERTEIQAEDWTTWLQSEAAQALQAINPDGLHDAPLVYEGALLGTWQELLAGRLEFPDLHYRLWMEALAAETDPHAKAGQQLLTAAVSIGNRVIGIAGLNPHDRPKRRHPRPVIAPPAEEYERLRAALRLELEDPEETAPLLEPLQQSEGLPRWQPLSREADDLFLVADPWQLSMAALVRGVGLAAESPRFEAIAERVRRSAIGVVVNAVEEMEWSVESIEEDYVIACADVDCRVAISVSVLVADPSQLLAEVVRSEAALFESYERARSLARTVDAQYSLQALIGDGRGVEISTAHPSLHAGELSDPWMIGVPEVQVLGEALRKDPLALPAALSSLARPPWPPNFDLLDMVGMVRQGEEEWRRGRKEPIDGTEYMLARAKLMATRQTVPAPDLSEQIEISRWEGIEEPAVFRRREPSRFELCVCAPSRCLWVTCPATLEQRHELLPAVAVSFAFWLARLCKAGFLLEPAAVMKTVFVRFALELDQRPGPQLVIVSADKGARIIVGQGFVEALCKGDNDSDRMLVGAVLEWALVWDKAIDIDLDQIVPAGRGTILVWPDREVAANPPLLEPPPPVESRAAEAVERALAARVVKDGQILVASNLDLAPVLEELARSLESMIQANGELLEPEALRELVALHERAAFQSKTEAVFLPASSAIGVARLSSARAGELLYRDLVLRILIERFSAIPPCGSQPFSLRMANGLRAATELQFELRGALESVRWEGAEGQVIVSTDRGVVFNLDSGLPAANEAMRGQVAAAAPDSMARAHPEWWRETPKVTTGPVLDSQLELEGNWQGLDLAMREEWGIGFEQILRLLLALSALAEEESDCVSSLPREAVERKLADLTKIPHDAVAAGIEHLTLGPCPGYDTFREEHQPGRANRDRSYIRRPLVALPGDELCWSSMHTRRAAEYFVSLVESGRLRGSRHLEKHVSWISQELDRDFEDAVLVAVLGCGWKGRARVTHLAGKQLQRSRHHLIGDIDVLAWSGQSREVWLLDAKRLAPGVEPGPMLREGKTFEGHVEHHLERLQWVLDHQPELAQQIGIADIAEWEIRAALVLDRPLVGAHLGNLPMPIWTLWELPQALAGEIGSAA